MARTRRTVLAVALFVSVLSSHVRVLASGTDFHDQSVQQYLLQLARSAFDSYALTRSVIDPPSRLPEFCEGRYGIFVGTMINGAPRTCMGTIYPCQANLAEEVIQNSVASAGRDRRFPAVKPSELSRLNLIISVLESPPRPISLDQAHALDPVSDGVAVLYGDRYGVVLSGETDSAARMVDWGRIRAGAPVDASVRFFEIKDIRFMESQFK